MENRSPARSLAADRQAVDLVSDGTLHMDAGGVFGIVPKALWRRVVAPDEKNRGPLALNCLLIRSGGTTVLVDTGMGESVSPCSTRFFGLERCSGLLASLERLGVKSGVVDIVINTHLRLHHCGGNTRQVEGSWVPTFPRAEYWIQQGEREGQVTPMS